MGAALVVPLVSVIVPAIVSIVHDLIQLFKKEPKQPAVTDAGAGAIGLTKDEAIRSARETFGLDAVRNWNFGIIGQVKAGKSSLVNAVQGLKDNEPGAAQVGVVEVVNRPQSFPMRDTFTEPDLWVLNEAKKYNIPVGLVRTKSDMHISNIMHSDNSLSPEEAQLKLIREARSNVEQNVDRAHFDNLHPKLFIASSRVLYCCVTNKQMRPEWREIDEEELLRWVREQAQKRIQHT
ncbi:hypothetical protein WJX79_000178 [Trebouxia sp. C0005]